MKLVTLRKMQNSDMETIFEWQQKKTVRQFSINRKAPNFEEHKKWFFSKVKSEVDFFYMINYGGNDCGTIRFDYISESEGYLLSWYLIPGYYGLGIGTNALIMALKKFNVFKVIAFVHSHNQASIKSLIKAGFLKIKENHYEYKNLSGEI
jgi:UDP-2,4-diacetamido-2,4,6-trideoxy-beta-L-altropyranose hydrolase